MSSYTGDGAAQVPGNELLPAHPPAAQEGRSSTEQRPPGRGRQHTRHTQLVIASLLVLLGLAVIFLTARGSPSPPEPHSAKALTTARSVSALLSGIPQSANVLGRPAAPVTLRWYGDLQCPYCRAFTLGALPSIIRRWVRGGQMKIEYLSMQSATREPKVFQTQQVAALAAGAQNRMWNYIETFYHEQGEEGSGYVTEQFLRGLAGQIPGLDVGLWNQDRYDPLLAARVKAESQAAKRARYPGTPTFLIGHGPGGLRRLRPGSFTRSQGFDQAIEALLAG